LYQKTEEVVGDDRSHHHKDEPRLSPGIEKKTGPKKKIVLQPSVMPQKGVIDQ
jgi:hypothetical protein